MLKTLYRSLGSWGALSKRLGGVPKATVRAVALGERRVTPELWEQIKLQNPRTLRRRIRKIAVPFLERAQLMRGKSKRGIYGRGGVPL